MTTKRQMMPMRLNAALIHRHALKGSNGERVHDPALARLAAAVNAGADAAVAISDAHDAILANRMATIEARHAQSREVGFARLEKVAARMDEARKNALVEINTLRAATALPAAPVEPGRAIMATEIRSALARMTEEDRSKALSEAIVAGGDDSIVAAVLSAPAILSGTTPTQHATLGLRWRHTRFPKETDRERRITAAIDDLDRAHESLVAFIDGLTDAAKIAEAQALEQAAALAAKAAAGE